MRRLIVATLAAQALALAAVAETAPAPPNTSIPEISAKDTAKLPAIESVAPSKTNTGMTTPPTPKPADSAPLPGALTEAEATRHIEAAGYRNVTGLVRDRDNVWRGKAEKGALPLLVSVDFKGIVATY